jgi:hypothetical protein
VTQDERLKLRIQAAEAMGWVQVTQWGVMTHNKFVVGNGSVYLFAEGAWNPDTDLNQSVMLAERFGLPTISKLDTGGWEGCVWVNNEADAAVSDHPALALTLAAIQAWEAGKK